MVIAVNSRVLDLLLVEDDPGDVVMTREALAEHGRASVLHVVTDGVQALAFLRRESPFADAPTPDLILLDLNLPKMGGKQILAEVKADPALRHIPVVVLTTSGTDSDVRESYELQASAFVTKPIGYEGFAAAVGEIDRFFSEVVTLPKD